MWNKRQRELIKNYVHPDIPLGPTNSTVIDDKFVHTVLFEQQNLIQERLRDRPSLIVGRRGSGKTAFLQHQIYGKKYKVTVEIKTWHAFLEVLSSVKKTLDRDGFIFTENVAELWDLLLWIAISTEVQRTYPDEFGAQSLINKLIRRVGLAADISSSALIIKALEVIRESAERSTVRIISDVLLSILVGQNASLQEMKEDTIFTLKKHNASAIIVMDSLDDYELSVDSFRKTLSGLLMCVGSFNLVRGRPEIRLCLPAELYHIFTKISDNRLKDFTHRLVLHWHAGELLSLCAHRYQVYLDVWEENELDLDFNKFIKSLDLHSRKDAITFFKRILPERIKNKVGIPEYSIPYILRHTQLLPRQIISLINSILIINRNEYRNAATTVHPNAVTEGITSEENNLWKEVCRAFRYRYPYAQTVCDAVLPELPLVFSDGELHSIYVHFGKNALQQGLEDSLSKSTIFYDDAPNIDYRLFKRMLIEIGCVGACLDRDLAPSEGAHYIDGVFEYTMPDTLNPSTDTLLCLHPMFSGNAKYQRLSDQKIRQVIYPYGTHPEGQDYRG